MKDLYSVRLEPKEVNRACEEYVLRGKNHTELVARAQGETPVLVIVATKRVGKPKGSA